MKIIHYTLATCIAIFSFNSYVFAQKQNSNSILKLPIQSHQNSINHGGAKSTASRLIGSVYATYNGTIYEQTDSTTYVYSNGRGLSNQFGWLADIATSYIYNPSITNYDNSGKSNYTYDANNHITSILVQTWNNSTNSYQNSAYYVVNYDANFNLSNYIIQSWDATGSIWINSSQYNLTYDTHNNLLSQISTVWNTATSAWENQNKDIYTYDANNNMLTRIYQSWNTATNAWENQSKNINTYNAANKVLSNIYQNWNTTTNAWENSSNLLNTYNTSNLLTNELSKFWNTTTNMWENGSQTYHQYNSNNDDTLSLIQYWNGTSWDNANKYLQTYNTSHSLTLQIYQNWNSGTNLFENYGRNRYTYNSYNQQTSFYKDSWNIGGFWKPDTLNFDNASRNYYETYQTGVESVNISSGIVNVYPNPTTNLLNINVSAEDLGNSIITIFNTQGILVKQWNIGNQNNYNTSISTQSLAAGNYYLMINGNSGKRLTQTFTVSK